MTKKPIAGKQYRHSKTGNLYTALAVAVYCGKWSHGSDEHGEAHRGFPEGTELVVYVGHYNNARGNRVYVRPVSEWFEEHLTPKGMLPRFVEENDA
jgi:hypothetical protein